MYRLALGIIWAILGSVALVRGEPVSPFMYALACLVICVNLLTLYVKEG